jgi:hypothetical protein
MNSPHPFNRFFSFTASGSRFAFWLGAVLATVFWAPLHLMAANEKVAFGTPFVVIEGGMGNSFAHANADGIDLNAVGTPPDGSVVYMSRPFRVTSTVPNGTAILIDLFVELQGDSSIEIKSGTTTLAGPFTTGGTKTFCVDIGTLYTIVGSADAVQIDFTEAYAIATFLPPRFPIVDLAVQPLVWSANGTFTAVVTASGNLRCSDSANVKAYWASAASPTAIIGPPLYDSNFSIGPAGAGMNRLEKTFSCSAFSNPPLGGIYIVVIADPENAIPESSEGNNFAAISPPLKVTGSIPSFSVTEDSAATGFDLRQVFSHSYLSTADLFYSVVAHSNLGLVQASVDNLSDTLLLSYAPDQFGTATITVRASDNCGFAAEVTFTVTVLPVNDPPCGSFKLNSVVVPENAGARSFPNFATFDPGPDNEILETLNGYSVSNNHNTLFATQPVINNSGTLTFTPAPNQSGSATVTVIIQDSGGTQNGGIDTCTQTFTITITPNTCPVVAGAIPDVSVLEDAGNMTIPLRPVFQDLETADADLVYTIQANNNPTLVSATVDPAADTLTLHFNADQNGDATLTTRATDASGCFVDDTFMIHVAPVNDLPVVTVSGNVTVLEDSGLSQFAFATFSPGPPDEASQALVDYHVSNNNPGLFTASPSISDSGRLAFKPSANANGSATVTVSAKDNGGAANGGIDTSMEKTFTITLTPVNDRPVIRLKTNVVVVATNAGSFYWTNFASFKPGPDNEAAQSLLGYTLSHTNQPLFSVQPAINKVGLLSFTPATNTAGSTLIRVTGRDDGGIANGGVDKRTVSFTVVVGQPAVVTPLLLSAQAAEGTLNLTVLSSMTGGVVTEWSSNLFNWTPLETNSLSGENIDLDLPLETNGVPRFFRAKSLPTN